jgi:hypothetical protein
MNGIPSRSKLNAVEWRVVAIARKDGPRSINPEGFWARLSRDLFGLPTARLLADDGLEALRRFCVRAWHWDLIRASDLKALTDAGYSKVDAVEILTHVARYRGFVPSIREGA